MRIVRFQREPESIPLWGWITGDRIGLLEGSPFEKFKRQKADLSLEGVTLIAPVQPGKIVCVGRNYPAHAAEHGVSVPEIPLPLLQTTLLRYRTGLGHPPAAPIKLGRA